MLFDYYVLKIDAELFSESKHGPKINAVTERCFKLFNCHCEFVVHGTVI